MRRRSLILLVLLAASGAGCGSAQAPGTASKADAQAKATLVRSAAADAKVCSATPADGAGTLEAARREVASGSRLAASVDRLRALGAPRRDRALLERYLSSLQASVRTLPQLRAALDRRRLASVRTLLDRLGRQHRTQAALARRYGLEGCPASG